MNNGASYSASILSSTNPVPSSSTVAASDEEPPPPLLFLLLRLDEAASLLLLLSASSSLLSLGASCALDADSTRSTAPCSCISWDRFLDSLSTLLRSSTNWRSRLGCCPRVSPYSSGGRKLHFFNDSTKLKKENTSTYPA